jgi:very-short-patch-repair endonuclease
MDRAVALERAQQLRRNQTEAERRLWYHLRARRLGRLKFRRQVPVGPYIVDFLCHDAMLVVEVDGGQHNEEQQRYDQRRDAFLRSKGLRVMRFWNHVVLADTEAVLAEILRIGKA